mmetsp:Transcript_16255/g.21362  ORF Transcript_16255/g.21362 Transcript_16255/m.21362 type:complete len:260 (+) Transcript_16255:558-1337(+)
MSWAKSSAEGLVLTEESRLFQLDFAWFDFTCSLVLVNLLLWAKKSLVLKSAYYFGLFALFMDYGVYFNIQGSRTIEMVNNDSPMGTFERFCFFFWFDTMNAADIVAWALINLEDLLPNNYKVRRKGRFEWTVLFLIPLWFWATPLISRQISFDDRLLLASRPSQKFHYYILCILFILCMRFRLKLTYRSIARIIASGIACGLIHHGPLYYFGMRGYQSKLTFIVTLLSEWPPIICGLFVITYLLCEKYPRLSAMRPKDK